MKLLSLQYRKHLSKIMDLQTRKLYVIQEILAVSNEKIMDKLESLLKSDRSKDEILGYTPEGNPINKEAYVHDIDEARRQIKDGKYISQEELEKRSKNW